MCTCPYMWYAYIHVCVSVHSRVCACDAYSVCGGGDLYDVCGFYVVLSTISLKFCY